MRSILPILAVSAFLLSPVIAQDLAGPRSAPRYNRVFLYVTGTSRVMDYSDVVKIHASDANGITFETSDGFVIVHRGPFTLIGPKNDLLDQAAPGGRSRFFDAK